MQHKKVSLDDTMYQINRVRNLVKDDKRTADRRVSKLIKTLQKERKKQWTAEDLHRKSKLEVKDVYMEMAGTSDYTDPIVVQELKRMTKRQLLKVTAKIDAVPEGTDIPWFWMMKQGQYLDNYVDLKGRWGPLRRQMDKQLVGSDISKILDRKYRLLKEDHDGLTEGSKREREMAKRMVDYNNAENLTENDHRMITALVNQYDIDEDWATERLITMKKAKAISTHELSHIAQYYEDDKVHSFRAKRDKVPLYEIMEYVINPKTVKVGRKNDDDEDRLGPLDETVQGKRIITPRKEPAERWELSASGGVSADEDFNASASESSTISSREPTPPPPRREKSTVPVDIREPEDAPGPIAKQVKQRYDKFGLDAWEEMDGKRVPKPSAERWELSGTASDATDGDWKAALISSRESTPEPPSGISKAYQEQYRKETQDPLTPSESKLLRKLQHKHGLSWAKVTRLANIVKAGNRTDENSALADMNNSEIDLGDSKWRDVYDTFKSWDNGTMEEPEKPAKKSTKAQRHMEIAAEATGTPITRERDSVEDFFAEKSEPVKLTPAQQEWLDKIEAEPNFFRAGKLYKLAIKSLPPMKDDHPFKDLATNAHIRKRHTDMADPSSGIGSDISDESSRESTPEPPTHPDGEHEMVMWGKKEYPSNVDSAGYTENNRLIKAYAAERKQELDMKSSIHMHKLLGIMQFAHKKGRLDDVYKDLKSGPDTTLTKSHFYRKITGHEPPDEPVVEVAPIHPLKHIAEEMRKDGESQGKPVTQTIHRRPPSPEMVLNDPFPDVKLGKHDERYLVSLHEQMKRVVPQDVDLSKYPIERLRNELKALRHNSHDQKKYAKLKNDLARNRQTSQIYGDMSNWADRTTGETGEDPFSTGHSRHLSDFHHEIHLPDDPRKDYMIWRLRRINPDRTDMYERVNGEWEPIPADRKVKVPDLGHMFNLKDVEARRQLFFEKYSPGTSDGLEINNDSSHDGYDIRDIKTKKVIRKVAWPLNQIEIKIVQAAPAADITPEVIERVVKIIDRSRREEAPRPPPAAPVERPPQVIVVHDNPPPAEEPPEPRRARLPETDREEIEEEVTRRRHHHGNDEYREWVGSDWPDEEPHEYEYEYYSDEETAPTPGEVVNEGTATAEGEEPPNAFVSQTGGEASTPASGPQYGPRNAMKPVASEGTKFWDFATDISK
jgi:hypothetical protein